MTIFTIFQKFLSISRANVHSRRIRDVKFLKTTPFTLCKGIKDRVAGSIQILPEIAGSSSSSSSREPRQAREAKQGHALRDTSGAVGTGRGNTERAGTEKRSALACYMLLALTRCARVRDCVGVRERERERERERDKD